MAKSPRRDPTMVGHASPRRYAPGPDMFTPARLQYILTPLLRSLVGAVTSPVLRGMATLAGIAR
eukprot:2443489-Prymnesium_polylepis.2